MSMMGELNFFLGLQIKQTKDGIFINQAKYTKELLKRFNMEESNAFDTPMSSSLKLDKDERVMIFQACPKESHLVAVKRILRYLKGTHNLGLWFPRNTSFFDLVGYSDADYAGCKTERKSTSGGCQFLGHSLVSWSSKKQNSVALSTTVAEYVAVDSGLELDESDVWSSVGGGGVSPNYRKPVVSSRKKLLTTAKRAEAVVGGTASSLPVNIPDWAKILKEDYKDNRRRDIDDDVDGEDLEEGGDRVPPHEFLARQFARTRIASFSEHSSSSDELFTSTSFVAQSESCPTSTAFVKSPT
ncbi:hypothetical protein RJ640_013413 [Escallonia rubra]|uniref:Reverse transcriptase Ty1/copia-type domain-containing protein n=1 Tax=Escallonia rubra TaxID=112253 RepID=A0AA88UG83_9ASTE|nr:hypothetical protein RJ640_013413 [Escallonia rubra]